MNILDWSIIGIFVLFMCHGFAKGFIKSIFGLLSTIIAVAASLFAYPIVSKTLINTDIYVRLKQTIMSFIEIKTIKPPSTTFVEMEFINNLKLPEYLLRSATTNNNPVVYNILNANSFEDYICGYFATIIINVISILVIFIIVKIALKVIELALDAISKLPIVNLANRVAGLTIGIAQATFLVWIFMAAGTLFFFSQNIEFMNLLRDSTIAYTFCENNPIMKFITDINP